jgi:hemerythrin-like domain-containing protein
MTLTDVFERIRREHQRLLELVEELERGTAAAEPGMVVEGRADGAGDAVRRLAGLFAGHAAAEERELFPALVQALPGALANLAPFEAEHGDLLGMLEELVRLHEAPATPGRDEQIAVQAQDVADLLRIHLRKEEAAVIRVAERLLAPQTDESPAARPAGHGPTPPSAPATGA